MSVISLGASRFDREDDPAKIALCDALEAALDKVRAPAARHVFVCIAYEGDNGGVRAEWLQAGNYDCHSQLGLLERCKIDLINSAIES